MQKIFKYNILSSFNSLLFSLGKHNKFSTSSILYFPSANNPEDYQVSNLSTESRSLPNLDRSKLNNPQPPFECDSLNLNKQLSTAFREKKPKTEQEMDKLAEPIFEQRAKAIEQYEKELEEDAQKFAKAIIERQRNEEISYRQANYMIRENNTAYKRELEANAETCEVELRAAKEQLAIMKQSAQDGIDLFQSTSTTNTSQTERSSLLDDYADTSSEMPDYTGGDD